MIHFICNNLYPYNFGGAEIFNYYLINYLNKYKKVACISFYNKSSEYDDLKFIRLYKIKPLVFFSSLQIFLYLLINAKKNDHLILTFSRSRWLNWIIYFLLKKIKNIEYSIVIHGGGITNWKFKLPFQVLFRNATNIVGVSERICKNYTKRTGVKIKFIPPLIPYKEYNSTKAEARKIWDIKNDETVIVSVGSLKPLKNPDTLLEAVLILGKDWLRKNKVKIFFAGNGPMKQTLVDNIRKSGLEEYVFLLGNVTRERIPSLYKSSDIFYIGSDFEGTPLSLLEAMFNSLFIIASDSPGINSIIKNEINGLLFKTKNAEDLAEKLDSSIKHNSFEKFGKNAKEDYDYKYSYNDMIEQYKDMLVNVK